MKLVTRQRHINRHTLITKLVWLTSPKMERETGIEPATNSLEGCDSTTELLPRIPLTRATKPVIPSAKGPLTLGGEGRIRTSEAARATDLQSVAFDRSATSPTLHRRSAIRSITSVGSGLPSSQ